MKITREMLKSIIEESLNECGMDDVEYEDHYDDLPSDSEHMMDHGSDWEEDRGGSGPFDAPDEEHPGYMLLGNLKKLAAKASDLAGLATPWDDAEPWIESKINSAAEHIDAIHDYIMYSVLKKDFNPAAHEEEMMHECGEPMPVDMHDASEPMGHMDGHATSGRNFGTGGDAHMAKGQLFNIARKSQSLYDRLSDEDTLPEWLQAKVTMAYQTISTVSDYLDYKMNRHDSGSPVYEGRSGLQRIVRETVRSARRSN